MLQTFDRIGPFIVVLSQSEAIPARKRRVVVRCVVCERVSEMNERSLLDKRTEEQRGCAKCRVYTTNGTWVKGWKAKMESTASEANRLNEENARLRDEIDKVLRERDEARAVEEHLRGQYQYSVGLSMALEERDEARADLEDYRARNEIMRIMLERCATERDEVRATIEQIRRVFGNALAFDDARGDVVKMAEIAYRGACEGDKAIGQLRDMTRQRDEARAEVERAIIDRNHAEARARAYLIDASDDFRRGAEAMREACAGALLADGLVLSRERAANVVRALPIPEET